MNTLSVSSNLSVEVLDAALYVSDDIHAAIRDQDYVINELNNCLYELREWCEDAKLTTDQELSMRNAKGIKTKLMLVLEKQKKEGKKNPDLPYHLLTEVGLMKKSSGGFVHVNGGAMASIKSRMK